MQQLKKSKNSAGTQVGRAHLRHPCRELAQLGRDILVAALHACQRAGAQCIGVVMRGYFNLYPQWGGTQSCWLYL